MESIAKELPRFFSTADVRKILKIGNKTCLELFHRDDFPCIKVGRSYKISEKNFEEYFNSKTETKDESKK